jgi:dihydrofolate synthase/folylpolyglutamate synthase
MVEVGMGGRFDATNVLEPLVSVITNVDYDHEAFLGDTISKIAAEKAGIIKPHTPVVSAVGRPEAIQVIEETCKQQKSRLTLLEKKASDGLGPCERQVQAPGFAGDWPGPGGIASGASRPPYSNTWGHRRSEARTGPHIETVWVDGRSPADFDYHGQKMTLRHLDCPLLGHHQIVNAGTVLATVELLSGMEMRLSEESIRKGLRSVRWDGRLEIVKREPLVLLDGAHNPAGAKVLGNFLAEMKQVRKGRLILLVGILADKNIRGILKEIAPFADEVILTRPDYSGAASLERLRKGLGDYTLPITPRETIPEAMAYALARLLPQDILCVTGSLYTVGAAKAFLEGREKPLVFRG